MDSLPRVLPGKPTNEAHLLVQNHKVNVQVQKWPVQRGKWVSTVKSPVALVPMQILTVTSLGCDTAAAAKSLQSCPTLCNSIDGSPLGSSVPGILQARILEWVAVSFSNEWKWSCSVVPDSSRPYGLQPTRLLRPWDFPGKNNGVGCHCLLRFQPEGRRNSILEMFTMPRHLVFNFAWVL